MHQQNCSIIILAHAGEETTEACLKSILLADSRPREIFVIDNASAGTIPRLIAEFADKFRAAGVEFITWRNDFNKGCSAARNDAWEKASGKYTVFMDNDAAVCTGDWLDRLCRRMESEPELGILGPKLIYPFQPHLIQCAGVSFNHHGRVCFRGRGSERGDPRFSEYRQVHALISACWIMRTKLLQEIGGLDELFHPVQYEDLDLCLRAAAAGWRIACAPEVEMYHFEGTSTESGGQTAYQKNIAGNSLKFRQRWHHIFKKLPEDPFTTDFTWIPRAELGLSSEVHLPICL